MMRRLLLKLFRRRLLQRDLENELRFHREMAAAAGNAIPFGNTGYVLEQARDLWRFNALENLWRDVLFAFRTLRKSPGLVLTALLSLGLGIGMNAAMFSLAVGFLLSQPSVRDASSIVYVRQGGNSHVLPDVLQAFRNSGVFQDVAGENAEGFVNFNDGVETRRIFAAQATKNYFDLLGVPVSRGRGWTESDPDTVAVLHPRFWGTRLGADPGIVGKTLRLDGRLYTVLGVLPDNYRSLVGYGYAPDIYIPQYIDGTLLQAYARLKPGMTLPQTGAALRGLGERLHEQFPSQYDAGQPLNAMPVSGFAHIKMESEGLTVTLFFAVLLVMVGMVLLIACVNVAGLLLARAAARRHEIAIRLALGATRGRLLQQLLAESVLLSAGGVTLGLLFTAASAKIAAAITLPLPVPIRIQMEPDWRVVSYAVVIALISALAGGLAPAWQTVRESLSAGMRREGRLRLRRALVIVQIAVSFVVLTAAALFVRNLLRASSLGPGFDVRHTVRAEVYLPPATYKNNATIQPYVNRALEQLQAIPGVECFAAARIIPFTDSTRFGTNITFSGSAKEHASFNWNAVTPDYFRAMDIPVLKGRPFTSQDYGAAKVVIVNDVFVQKYLVGREPVGATFFWSDTKAPYRIVGVVRRTKNMTIGEDPTAQLYEPLAQIDNDRQRIQFVVRSKTPPAAQLSAVRQALRQAEPAAGLEVETMFSAIGFAFLPSQVGAALMGSIGALGLLLVVIGLYGVLAYSVTRRTREIGIRMAVGASPQNVARVVLQDFARLLAAGLGLGVGIATLVTRPLSLFLVPGLSASDPASFAIVGLVLGLTGVLASLGPLYRAVRIDPLQCLRTD